MHAVIFGLVGVGCAVSAVVVSIGDIGDNVSLGYRVKAVLGFLVPAVYFCYSAWREVKRTRRVNHTSQPKHGEDQRAKEE
jgi:phosphate/sulfate permease